MATPFVDGNSIQQTVPITNTIPQMVKAEAISSCPNAPNVTLPTIAPILPIALKNPNAVDLIDVGDNSVDTTSNALHAQTVTPLNTHNNITISVPLSKYGIPIIAHAPNATDIDNVVFRSQQYSKNQHVNIAPGNCAADVAIDDVYSFTLCIPLKYVGSHSAKP